MIVTVRAFGSPALTELLGRHPFVSVESFEESETNWMEFDSGRLRRVYQGNPSIEQYGLTELMDNNPLVCAVEASVTGPAATLALIGLGPLAKAELIAEMPAIALNFGPATDEIDAALATEGWLGGCVTATDDGVPDVLVAQCVCEIRMPNGEADIHTLFDESFGRSFFVRAGAVTDRTDAHAVYSLAIENRGDGTGLAKVVVSASRDGKCGGGGLLHMFNVMCGFEESLGVA